MGGKQALNNKFPGANGTGPKVNLIAPVSRKHHKYTAEEAQKVANAIVQQINGMAAQLFEMQNHLTKLILFKPRRVYKQLAREHQNLIEKFYGEHILRNIVLTKEFSFPSEDLTG